ncbi:MAG: DUF5320 domain-containing protein [Clostridiales bacterium]|nr:DUF5320 domain-containing protein [Clostridiales bacterium]
MPRGNGTGPMGMGPMTGRGFGYCAGYAAAGSAGPAGFGCRFAGKRGNRRMFYATGLPGWMRFGAPAIAGTEPSDLDKREFLSRQAKLLENQLEQVKERLAEFKEAAE